MSPTAVGAGRFETLPLRQVRSAGAYLSLTTGRLYQIPPAGVPAGRPVAGTVRASTKASELVIRLAEDPLTPLWKLNRIAHSVLSAAEPAVG